MKLITVFLNKNQKGKVTNIKKNKFKGTGIL